MPVTTPPPCATDPARPPRRGGNQDAARSGGNLGSGVPLGVAGPRATRPNALIAPSATFGGRRGAAVGCIRPDSFKTQRGPHHDPAANPCAERPRLVGPTERLDCSGQESVDRRRRPRCPPRSPGRHPRCDGSARRLQRSGPRECGPPSGAICRGEPRRPCSPRRSSDAGGPRPSVDQGPGSRRQRPVPCGIDRVHWTPRRAGLGPGRPRSTGGMSGGWRRSCSWPSLPAGRWPSIRLIALLHDPSPPARRGAAAALALLDPIQLRPAIPALIAVAAAPGRASASRRQGGAGHRLVRWSAAGHVF